jgi:hypothetical protein
MALTAFVPILPIVFIAVANAQESDLTQTPNAVGAGIYKSLEEQIGAGRGDGFTPDSSSFLIARDPFRAIVRGRQLFQRKFTQAQGVGQRTNDGEATSKATPRSSPDLPTAARPVTQNRAALPAVAVASSRGPTAATRHICSAWGCRRC